MNDSFKAIDEFEGFLPADTINRLKETLEKYSKSYSGQWIKNENASKNSNTPYKCSNCGRRASVASIMKYKHCPSCGSKNEVVW